MTYTEFVRDQIRSYKVGQPIYSAEISENLALAYGLPQKNAAGATAVAFKRITNDDSLPNLRFYQKGIYYFTDVTPFGEVGIDKESLIADKYLLPNEGYETGFTALYRIGLSTQLPRERCIVTNKATDRARTDARLGVTIRPPKTKVTKDNKAYLQLLDVLDLMEKAPVDAEQPYVLLAGYIKQMKLEYEHLLSLADRYYNKKTVIQLAHTASEGGLL